MTPTSNPMVAIRGRSKLRALRSKWILALTIGAAGSAAYAE